MTLEQRVGQLLMVGVPSAGLGDAAVRTITDYHVGNVILTGNSVAGVAAIRTVSDAVQRHASCPATASARQLSVAGVNVNLAPVMDTVTSSFAHLNPPIGVSTGSMAMRHAVAAGRGVPRWHAAWSNVVTTIKHVPGLGVSAATPTPPAFASCG